MKPLIVLLAAFFIALVIIYAVNGVWNYSFAGCIVAGFIHGMDILVCVAVAVQRYSAASLLPARVNGDAAQTT